MVERDNIVTGATVEPGDVVLGLPSNGLHTNGYSLARKLLFEVADYTPETYVNELKGKVGDELHEDPPQLSGPCIQKLLAADCVSGTGAHHRRRHHRKPAARSAQAGWRP